MSSAECGIEMQDKTFSRLEEISDKHLESKPLLGRLERQKSEEPQVLFPSFELALHTEDILRDTGAFNTVWTSSVRLAGYSAQRVCHLPTRRREKPHQVG